MTAPDFPREPSEPLGWAHYRIMQIEKLKLFQENLKITGGPFCRMLLVPKPHLLGTEGKVIDYNTGNQTESSGII